MDNDNPKNLVQADFINKQWIPSDEHMEKLWERLQNNPSIVPIPPAIETQIIYVDFSAKKKVG